MRLCRNYAEHGCSLGHVLMSRSHKSIFAVMLACVAILIGIVLWLQHRPGVEPIGVTGATRAVAADGAPTEVESARKSSDRARVDGANSSADAPTKVVDRTRPRITGIVVDVQGTPVSGAHVELWMDSAQGYSVLDLGDEKERRARLATATSSTDGRFAFDVASHRQYELNASKDGLARATRLDVSANDDVRIVLHAGATLEGVVTRASDRTPVDGARVVGYGEASDPVFEVRTDLAGRWRATAIPPGDLLVQVIPERESSVNRDVTLADGERKILDVAVNDGATLRGTVIEKATGLPIQGAEVSYWSFLAKTTTTAADGTYELHGFPTPEDLAASEKTARKSITKEVSARAAAHATVSRRVTCTGERELVANFELEPACVLRGRVVDAEGRAVPRAYVAAFGSGVITKAGEAEGATPSRDVHDTRSADDGRFEFGGVHPHLDYALVARAEGFASAIVAVPASTQATIEIGDVRLPRSALVAGVVVDDHDAPLADVGVTLRATRGRCTAEIALLGFVSQRETTTDARGQFEFDALAPDAYELRAHIVGRPPLEHVPLVVREGDDVRDVRLVMTEHLSIEGRVVDPFGAAVVDGAVEARRSDTPNAASITAKLDARGRFALNGLAAGTYDLRAFHYSASQGGAEAGHDLSVARVPRVSAGSANVVIQLEPRATIEGRVRDEDGKPLPFACVAVDDDSNLVHEIAFADAKGNFSVGVPASARVRMRAVRSRARSEMYSGREAIDLDTAPVLAPDIAAGTKDVELKLSAPK